MLGAFAPRDGEELLLLVGQNVSFDHVESADFGGRAFLEKTALPDHVGLVLETHLCLKSPKPFLDTVSTGSGSDLVSDQHAIFPNNS